MDSRNRKENEMMETQARSSQRSLHAITHDSAPVLEEFAGLAHDISSARVDDRVKQATSFSIFLQ